MHTISLHKFCKLYTLVKNHAIWLDISISVSLCIENGIFYWSIVFHDLAKLTIQSSIYLECASTITFYLKLIQQNLHGLLLKVHVTFTILMDVMVCITAGVFCCWQLKMFSILPLIISPFLVARQISRQGFSFWMACWSYSVCGASGISTQICTHNHHEHLIHLSLTDAVVIPCQKCKSILARLRLWH